MRTLSFVLCETGHPKPFAITELLALLGLHLVQLIEPPWPTSSPTLAPGGSRRRTRESAVPTRVQCLANPTYIHCIQTAFSFLSSSKMPISEMQWHIQQARSLLIGSNISSGKNYRNNRMKHILPRPPPEPTHAPAPATLPLPASVPTPGAPPVPVPTSSMPPVW